MRENKKKKVFVAMSGGVDSSVAAALLKKATPNNFEKLFGRPTPKGFRGYDVTGVFMKVWYPDFLTCTWAEERTDAMRVCALLDIPFLTFDFEEEYKRDVVDYMIAGYKAGRTPNPDVMCNAHIKFGAFFKKARALGAEYIATGHHARLRREFPISNFQFPNKKQNVQLCVAKDKNKDQTYFLWTLTQDVLKHTLFPAGEYTKPDIRKIAHQFDLPTADKKDSQGLCFIGKIDMKEFLKHYIKEEQGAVLNEKGENIGQHEGVLFYTLGQRHGFTITKHTPEDLPHYIIAKDIQKNTLTVSTNPDSSYRQKAVKSIDIENVNWIQGEAPRENVPLMARTRYREKLQDCHITNVQKTSVTVVFEGAMPVASPGQSLVLYKNKECFGGGIII